MKPGGALGASASAAITLTDIACPAIKGSTLFIADVKASAGGRLTASAGSTVIALTTA